MNPNSQEETADLPKVIPFAKKDKRAKAREARKVELLAKGLKEDQVEAVLAQEAFMRLPIDQKVYHLMQAVHSAQKIYSDTIKELSREMVALHQNQEAIADAFDINLRAIEKHLLALGISSETQKKIVQEVSEAFMKEKAQLKKPAEDPEQKAVEAELKAAQEEQSATILTG